MNELRPKCKVNADRSGLFSRVAMAGSFGFIWPPFIDSTYFGVFINHTGSSSVRSVK